MSKLKFLAFSIFVLLSGCHSDPAINPAAVQYNYRVEKANSNGVIQVFDLNGNTAVQLRNLNSIQPIFFDESNKEISFKTYGELAVLNGVHKAFDIVSRSGVSKVFRSDLVADNRSVFEPKNEFKVSSPNNLNEDISLKLNKLKEELALLKKCIADHSCETKAQSSPVTDFKLASKVVKESARPNIIRVSFADNSVSFLPSAEIQKQLLDLAKNASSISVTGYTDGTYLNKTSESIAKQRALATKKFLMNNGIEEKLITTDYHPTGGFIADNNTKSGREINRRVEIQIL